MVRRPCCSVLETTVNDWDNLEPKSTYEFSVFPVRV